MTDARHVDVVIAPLTRKNGGLLTRFSTACQTGWVRRFSCKSPPSHHPEFWTPRRWGGVESCPPGGVALWGQRVTRAIVSKHGVNLRSLELELGIRIQFSRVLRSGSGKRLLLDAADVDLVNVPQTTDDW